MLKANVDEADVKALGVRLHELYLGRYAPSRCWHSAATLVCAGDPRSSASTRASLPVHACGLARRVRVQQYDLSSR
ncbi:MAG: hypothetical protein ACLTKG_04880 [Collinsella intestinalis]